VNGDVAVDWSALVLQNGREHYTFVFGHFGDGHFFISDTMGRTAFVICMDQRPDLRFNCFRHSFHS